MGRAHQRVAEVNLPARDEAILQMILQQLFGMEEAPSLPILVDRIEDARVDIHLRG